MPDAEYWMLSAHLDRLRAQASEWDWTDAMNKEYAETVRAFNSHPFSQRLMKEMMDDLAFLDRNAVKAGPDSIIPKGRSAGATYSVLAKRRFKEMYESIPAPEQVAGTLCGCGGVFAWNGHTAGARIVCNKCGSIHPDSPNHPREKRIEERELSELRAKVRGLSDLYMRLDNRVQKLESGLAIHMDEIDSWEKNDEI